MAAANNTKRKKSAKIKAGTVRSLSAAVSKPDDGSVSMVTEDLKKMRHISNFPQRQELCEILESDPELLAELVASLVKDYADLYTYEKGRTKYADFQVHWHDHVRQVAERGANLAGCDAQEFDDPADPPVLLTSSAAEKWSHIYMNAQVQMREIDCDTNLMVVHSIARSIFNQQQKRIHASKTGDKPSDAPPQPPQPSPDDALLRMCGAEIARMIKVWHTERSRRIKSDLKSTADLEKELSLLKGLCIPADEKSLMEKEIPVGIKNLDATGYLWVPHISSLPFLRRVDEVFRQQINETNFKKHGEALFKVTEVHFLKERDLLYGLFLSSFSVSETDELVRPLYNDLWSKMINLRKEDWRLSRQRIATLKSGKTGETTLMLRDELKPIAASKRLSNN